MNTRFTGSSSRLSGRLLIFVWAALLMGTAGAKAEPVKTLVQDTLYRADGSVAHGKVSIRWNGFSTSVGEAVAAGEMTVATDTNGGISIPLIANTGSIPSGGYYQVVIKLDDGTTSEEIWVVPAAASTTVAAVRAKVMPKAVAAQFVSRDYVDTALGALASVNLASPGAVGSTTPGTVNATGYSVNGLPLSSRNLGDGATLPQLDGGGKLAASAIPNNTANTSGNAGTATALASTPAQCTSGQFSTGVTVSGVANCAPVAYAQLSAPPLIPNLDTPGPIGTSAPSTINATNITASGTVAVGATLLDPITGISSARVNGVNNCSNPSTLDGCLMAATVNRAFVPSGIYPISSPLNLGHSVNGSGSGVDCAFGSVGEGSGGTGFGSIFQPVAGSAIWALQNLSGIPHGMSVSNCVFDLTQDSVALGGVNFGNTSNAMLADPKVLLPSAGSMVGYQFDGTLQSYWNLLVHPTATLSGNNASSNTHTGLLFTSSANSNAVLQGNFGRLGTFADFESGNSNSVVGGGSDGWSKYCAKFAGSSIQNHLYGVRCETDLVSTAGSVNPTALYFAPGSHGNSVEGTYGFGGQQMGVTEVNDLSGQNSWEYQSLNGDFMKRMFGGQYPISFGFNTAPFLRFAKSGLELHGELDVDNYQWNKKAGDFRQYVSPQYPMSTYTAYSISSGVITVTAPNVFAVGAHVTCATTTGTSIAAGYTVLASPTSSSWTATTTAVSSSGAGTGNCYETDNAITAVAVNSGVITFTGNNSWSAGNAVVAEVPTGQAFFLSGQYTVTAAGNTGSGNTGWSATAPTYSVTNVNACPAGGSCLSGSGIAGTIQVMSSGNQALPGMQVNLHLASTYPALSGVYTVTGYTAATGQIQASYLGATDTNGNQSTCIGIPPVCGTSQVYTMAVTPVLATYWPAPVVALQTDSSNNLQITAPGGSIALKSATTVPSIAVNGGTPITSASSANPQMVTCATGGTGAQYCGADGTWHTAAGGISGLPSGCLQLPCQVAQVSPALNSTITASTAYVSMYTSTQAGQYQMCGFEFISVAGAGAGTVQIFGQMTGDGFNRTPSIGSAIAVATLHNINNTSNSFCTYFYADSGTPILWSLNVVGSITTAPTLRYSLTLNYMGN